MHHISCQRLWGLLSLGVCRGVGSSLGPSSMRILDEGMRTEEPALPL